MGSHVYAYVCRLCDHEAHKHGLTDDGDLRAGPYVCSACGCSQPQDGDWEPMTRRQFQAWETRRAAGLDTTEEPDAD